MIRRSWFCSLRVYIAQYGGLYAQSGKTSLSVRVVDADAGLGKLAYMTISRDRINAIIEHLVYRLGDKLCEDCEDDEIKAVLNVLSDAEAVGLAKLLDVLVVTASKKSECKPAASVIP